MKKRKIILDCDPGHDDAIAIIMAKHPALKVLALTTVTGNQTLSKITDNALNLCDYLGLDIPVYAGMELPILRDLIVADYVHGSSGLDGHPFPPPTQKPKPVHAVQYIIDSIMASDDDITLVPIGPLTNIAMAMRLQPMIIPKIKEIVLMGGGVHVGNATPVAEFNIYVDPEAAHIVFSSGAPIVMMGLNLTHKAICTKDISKRMERLGNKASSLFADLMNFYGRAESRMSDLAGAALHDPTCIAWLIDPSCITLKDMYVNVEIQRGICYGQTVCDVRDITKKTPNVRVAMDIDLDKFWNIVEECIKLY
jgi:ribosylpyrimidine nucleosidase